MRSTRRLLLAAALLVAALPSCAPRHGDLAGQVRRFVLEHGGPHADERAAARHFYSDRSWRPAWIENGRPGTDALELRRALLALPGDGLHGWKGDVAAIDSALAEPTGFFGRRELPDTVLAALDVRLTRAWLAAARRLHTGVLADSQLDKAWRGRGRGPAPEVRLVHALAAHAVGESLYACVPRDPRYGALRTALANDVLAFQRRHGLDTTGVADTQTWAAMDAEHRARVRTVEANLERWRWLPDDRPYPRIEVNIADATLAAHADSTADLRMRVVIGDPRHPTPVFTSAIAWMDLNPTWTMTPRVIGEEVISSLRRHPDYFETHHLTALRFLKGQWVAIDHHAVQWDSVTSDTFRTFVRQSAGTWNPLGRIRFMLPNRFQVFLHDTNQRGLFARENRARSHGCVRLEKPLELAAWIRSRHAPTPVDSIRAALRDTTARRWSVEPHVPVDVLYWTAWADSSGALQLRPDLYGLDARLLQAIDEKHPERFELNPLIQWTVAP